MKNKNLKIRILICVIFVGILCLSFLFKNQIESFLNNDLETSIEQTLQCELKVHYIDVGQADAIAIEFPNKTKMLIDSGESNSKDDLKTYLLNNLTWENSEKTIDYFLITHPHEDHIGGGIVVFETFQVLNFLRPTIYTVEEANENGGKSYSTATFKNLIESSKTEENCVTTFFNSATELMFGECAIDFLSPTKVNYDNVNNYSPIMKLTYKEKVFIFTGDAEKEVEKEVVLTYPAEYLKADVLKVGHHGSNTSSCEEFLSVIRPKYSIISVGIDNSYGHPTKSTLENLSNYNSKIYRTDENGTVIAGVNSSGNLMFCMFKNNNISKRIELWYVVLPLAGFGCYLILTINIKNFDKTKSKKVSRKK